MQASCQGAKEYGAELGLQRVFQTPWKQAHGIHCIKYIHDPVGSNGSRRSNYIYACSTASSNNDQTTMATGLSFQGCQRTSVVTENQAAISLGFCRYLSKPAVWELVKLRIANHTHIDTTVT